MVRPATASHLVRFTATRRISRSCRISCRRMARRPLDHPEDGMMRDALFIVQKDLHYLLRRRETLLWTVAMPIIFFYFTGTVTCRFPAPRRHPPPPPPPS